MDEKHLTCGDLAELMEDIGLKDEDMALLAGVHEWLMMGIVRYHLGYPLTEVPVFSRLGIEVIEALYHTVQGITDPEERRGLGMYLTNELRTRGAGYVAWKILNAQHRESWIPEAP
jgi:hypothetical protein